MKIHIHTLETTDLPLDDIAPALEAAVIKHTRKLELGNLEKVVDVQIRDIYNSYERADGFLLIFKTEQN